MRRTNRHQRLLVGLAWVAACATLVLAGALGRAWALPVRVPLGQTIPPPPTATSTSAVSAQPTATWTPRPTWTRIMPQPSVAATFTPGVATRTQVAIPTHTETLRQPTATSGVPSPGMTLVPASTPTLLAPSATPLADTPPAPLSTAEGPSSVMSPTALLPEPIPLAFEVVVLSPFGGPGDDVQFILQVANVGYHPVDSVQVEVVFPDHLIFQFVECPRCRIDCPQCQGGAVPSRLALFIGLLMPGDQVIAPVHLQVADDAWPGQSQRTDWVLTATGLPAQTLQTEVVLPWAQLPATGGQ